MSRYSRLHALALVMLLLVGMFAQNATVARADGIDGEYFVDNTTDADLTDNPNACLDDDADNDCSFRQAIERANSDGGESTIRFNIPTTDANYDGGTGRWTIQPDSDLPALSEGATTIIGAPNLANPSLPAIILDGINVPATSAVGITITSASNRVERLAVINFNGVLATSGIGIRITGAGATGNRVVGSYIGVRPGDTTPTTLADRQRIGVQIDTGASGNFIGETTTLNDRNFIAGNGLSTGDGGIIILQAGNNTIQNNFIGFNLNGLSFVDVANTGSGIQVVDSPGNTIGGTVAAAISLRNYISNNTQYGIVVTGDTSDNNLIAGNYIGVDVTGLSAKPNALDGVIIAGSADTNTISGNAAVPSVISGNTLYGVRITATGTSGNRILGAFIGTNANGAGAIPNQVGGVRIEDRANGNFVGGSGAGEGNVISGNPIGISVGAASGFIVANTTIAGNFIGLNATGTGAVPNTTRGVSIEARAQLTTIGGATTADRNVIAGNGGPGVAIIGGSTTLTTTVQNNTIGLRRATAGGAFNTLAGNTIGVSVSPSSTATSIIANAIAGSTSGPGVQIDGPALNTTISSNTVTTNTLGGILLGATTGSVMNSNTVRANTGGPGISIGGSTDATVSSNTLLNNTAGGIVGGGVARVQLTGNTITGSSSGPGIQLGNSSLITITTTIIRGSGAGGIVIGNPTRAYLSNNQVYTSTGTGISIGSGSNITVRITQVLTSTLAGITIGDGSNVLVQGNTVRANTAGPGIQLGATNAVTVSSNIVQQNGGSGIIIGAGSNLRLSSNTVLTNTVTGIQLTSRSGGTIETNTVRGHSGDGIALTGASNLQINDNVAAKNSQSGIAAAGTNLRFQGLNANENGLNGLALTSVTSATVRLTTLDRNSQNGLLINGGSLITVTQQTSLSFNGSGGVGNGALLTGAIERIQIDDTSVYSNTLYGVQIGAGSGSQQQVKLTNNRITGNGISGSPPFPTDRGIVLNPDTASPGNNANPNHDIDPPLAASLRMNQAGTLFGSVDVTNGRPAACLTVSGVTCKVEIYRTNATTLDGQGRTRLAEVTPNVSGAFTANLGTPLPAQLALTATDGAGNTSRFGVFTLNPQVTITPPRSSSAEPGQVVTYVHYVTNTGNLDLNDLRLEYVSSRNWNQVTLNPPGAFALQAGQGRPVTVTITLPTGADERVTAGGAPDLLTITVRSNTTPAAIDDVTNTTTVLPKVVLSAAPTAILEGIGQPGDVLPYAYTITNLGNIDATLGLAVSTDLGPDWVTTLDPNVSSLVLERGETIGVLVTVEIPPFSTGVVSGTQALTTLAVSVTSPATPSENKTLRARTTVGLALRAVIVENEVADGAAEEITPFLHTVENRSNGTATFVLNYRSSLGSTITFREGDAVPLTGPNNDTFQLGDGIVVTPPINMQFFADVLVSRFADRGEVDTITIFLTDTEGRSIPNAFVTNRINITRGALRPRLYLASLAR
jgi:parallel beta-helix repeat protein